MPYIKDENRELIDMSIGDLTRCIGNKGDLNYAICQLVGRLILEDEISYLLMSEWIDGVHDAECELRRRLLESYENKKIKENGDVSSFVEILDRIED